MALTQVHQIRRSARRYMLNDSLATQPFPTTIGGNSLLLWFRASDIMGVANGGNVTTWPGAPYGSAASTSLNTASANKPTFTSNFLNGFPGVAFGGNASTEYMTLSGGATSFNMTGTFAIVLQTNTSQATQVLWSWSVSNHQIRLEANGANVNRMMAYDGTNIATSSNLSNTGNAKFLIWTKDTTVNDMAFYDTNVAESHATWTTGVFDQFCHPNAAETNWYFGTIAELMVYSTFLTATEINNLYTAYISPKYGI